MTARPEFPKRETMPDNDAVPVGFISSTGEVGGAEVIMYALLDHLDPSWVRVVVVLGDGPVVCDVRERGFSSQVVSGGRRWALLRAVLPTRRALRRARVSVVHANSFRAAAVAAVATLGTRMQIIWFKVDCGRDGWLANLLGRRCSQIVGLSETVNETFKGRTRRRTYVVYPGLPNWEFDPASGRRMVCEILDCETDAEVLVVSARLCPPKGQSDLIEILPNLIAQRPKIRVALLGPEETTYAGYETVLRRRVHELDLHAIVTFVKDRNDELPTYEHVIQFVSGCDLLVAPSKLEPESGWKEGFGLAPVEAMWVGTPVVASRHGSFPEVLGEYAVYFPEGDLEGLGDAILKILGDAELRERLIREGAEWVHQRYRVENTAEGIKQRYRAAAARLRD